MKIVICSREWNSSTGRYARQLVKYLEKIDNQNKYVVLLKPSDMDSWQPTNPNFSKLACPYKEFGFGEQLGLAKQIKSLQSDLVHFTMVQQPIRYRGKVVTTMNDLTTLRFRNPDKNRVTFTTKQKVYRLVNKIVARKSAALLTYSEFVKNDIAKFARINSRKITVTHLGADKIVEKPEPITELQDSSYIMYTGRPMEHKNLRRLIEAFALLKPANPDLKLVLVGKREALYRRHERMVKKNGISGVVFTGFVSEGQLRWLYEHARAYAMPSLSEGFGLPGLEAMAHGCPVVSSNATCLPEVYGDAAHYFDPLDVGDMAAKISEVLNDEALRSKLKAKGSQQVKKYSWRRMAEQTLEVYKQVIG